jgi:protein-disulfide isomerase
MKKQSVILASIAALLVAAAAGGTWLYKNAEREKQALAEKDKARLELLVRPDSHSMGPVDAKVTLVEFFDPECETCRAVYPGIKAVLQAYDGKLRLVMRYMPFHKNSVRAVAALEAASEQGRFWELLGVMFEKQPEWADHHAPKPELVPGYAKALGLDMKKFNASIAKAEHRTRVERDKADGEALGVRQTPTFFVNGRTLEQLSYEALKGLIEEELSQPDPSMD